MSSHVRACAVQLVPALAAQLVLLHPGAQRQSVPFRCGQTAAALAAPLAAQPWRVAGSDRWGLLRASAVYLHTQTQPLCAR